MDTVRSRLSPTSLYPKQPGVVGSASGCVLVCEGFILCIWPGSVVTDAYVHSIKNVNIPVCVSDTLDCVSWFDSEVVWFSSSEVIGENVGWEMDSECRDELPSELPVVPG